MPVDQVDGTLTARICFRSIKIARRVKLLVSASAVLIVPANAHNHGTPESAPSSSLSTC